VASKNEWTKASSIRLFAFGIAGACLGIIAITAHNRDESERSSTQIQSTTPDVDSDPEIAYELVRVKRAGPASGGNVTRQDDHLKLCDEPDPLQCSGRKYLISGDIALASKSQGKYRQIDYVRDDGIWSYGWADTAQLERMPVERGGSTDWLGRWQTDTKDIVIQSSNSVGYVIARGFGTYGTDDPERVRRGTISQGDFAAKFRIFNDRVAFAVGYDDDEVSGVRFTDREGTKQKTIAYSAGADFLCRIKLRRIGNYLIGEDNMKCGGHNFSFRAIYRKMKSDQHVDNRLNGMTFGTIDEVTW
jgi:hypothetical protein